MTKPVKLPLSRADVAKKLVATESLWAVTATKGNVMSEMPLAIAPCDVRVLITPCNAVRMPTT